MVAAATPSQPKSKDQTEAAAQETTGVARRSNAEERKELRSYGSRGRMLLCWCRDGGKHRPIYWEKIVPWWGEKRETDLRADLGPFFSAQSNLSSRRGRGRGGRRGKKGKERKTKTNIAFPSVGADGTQRGAGVKEPLSRRHREEDD